MFLLPRILFIVCWWARFDTLASWVDWFPIHTRPLFVMCLVTFASGLFGAIALIPLCGHSPQIQKKKKNKQFSYHISRTMGDCYTLQAESTFQWWIQGRGTGDPRPHLILRSNWFPKGGKKFFWRPPPLPLSKGLDDPPPPAPLSQGLDTVLRFRRVSKVRSSTFRTPVHTAKMCPLAG